VRLKTDFPLESEVSRAEMFHIGTQIEKELRCNRRIYINSNIIRKFICQMINCVIFQIVAGKFYIEIRHLEDL
jgi:hypothetical protein